MKGFLIDSSQAEPSFDEWLLERHGTTVYKLREVARMTASKKDYSVWISSLYDRYREEMAEGRWWKTTPSYKKRRKMKMDSMMFKGSVMTSRARILVLYASTYDMLNERQEKVTGCTVRYLFWGEEGEALGEQMEWDPRKPVGVQVAKCSIEIGLREKLPVAPALYDGDFEITTGGDGKPIMRLRNIAYVSNVCIAAHVNQGFMVPGMVSPEMQPVSYKMVREEPSDESPVVNPSPGTPAGNVEAGDQVNDIPEAKADTAPTGKQTGKTSK